MQIDLFGNIIQEEEEYKPRVKKSNPFGLLTNISKKDYPEDLSDYSPFLTNSAFSQRKDSVMYANEMNKYHGLPPEAQFDFYFYGMPKRNYFAKWAKMAKSEYTDMIMEYFNVSYKVAKQYERVLQEKQLNQIKTWYETRKGGK